MDEYSCTTREAALALGVCVRTAQLWVEQGQLRAWKTPGGHRRILRESVSAQLRARDKACGVAVEAFDVLIVEEDGILRQLLSAIVAGISPEISVRTACNGVEGLIRIGERQPHLLVTDLLAPGLDGLHLLNALSTSFLLPSFQIIVTTALSDAQLAAQGGLPTGAVAFHKPIQTQLFVAMVRSCNDGWTGQRRISK